MALPSSSGGRESRFAAYVEALGVALGHADRVVPLRNYCAGLLLPGDRKSIEPMAAIRAGVLPAIQQRGPIQAWIIDDTVFPKQGMHSVGVARQYCGHLGKQENCQVAVSLSVANQQASLPVAWQLYLPKAWAEDAMRRARAGVPDELRFATKPQIAREQIRTAQRDGIPPGTVLADAGYGVDTEFREGITALGLTYVVGIQSSASLSPPGQAPLPVKPWSGRRRPPSRVGRSANHKPVSARDLAASRSKDAWRRVTWRQGTNAPLALPPSASVPPTGTTTPPRQGPRNGASSNGRSGKPSPPSSGSPPCLPRPAAPAWSATRCRVGAPSAINRR